MFEKINNLLDVFLKNKNLKKNKKKRSGWVYMGKKNRKKNTKKHNYIRL